MQQQHAIRECRSLIQIMRHQDDRDGKPLAQIGQFHLQTPTRGAVHGAEGLIQQQYGGVARQSPRNGNTLLLPARKLRRAALFKPGKMHARKKGGGAFHTLSGRQMAHRGHDIAKRCHMRKQRIILKHQPNTAAMCRQVKPTGGVKPGFAIANDAAAFGMMQPGNSAECRGFACTRRADDRQQLPRRAIKRDIQRDGCGGLKPHGKPGLSHGGGARSRA